MRMVSLFFLLACSLLWIPAERYAPLVSANLSQPRPAGEIISGFDLHEIVTFPRLVKSQLYAANKELCFSVRFATYRRENVGKIAISWQQGRNAKRWQVESGELADNELRYFCPGRHLRLGLPFLVTIDGVQGVLGSSPTAWLTTDTSYGLATVNGVLTKTSLDVGIARKVHMSPAKLIRLDDGAFFVGWLCTLLTGLAALLWMQRAGPPWKRPPKKSDRVGC